jgi:GNAT superfamily N-acetyltransferase
MIALRQHTDALIHRIWQNDAEYFGSLGQMVVHNGYVLYSNPALENRYDPNHAGLLRLRTEDVPGALQSIIAHYEALGLDSVVYLDEAHRPASLASDLQALGFRPMVEWGITDLMAIRGEIALGAPDVTITHPATPAAFAQWAALNEPDPYSDAAIMRALRFTECSSPAVIPTIVWCDGVPAGRCLAFVHDGVGRIECVFVDPAFRRRGLAQGMVTCVAQEIYATGAVPYLLAAQGEEAQRIYQRIGFETILPNAVMTYARPYGTPL